MFLNKNIGIFLLVFFTIFIAALSFLIIFRQTRIPASFDPILKESQIITIHSGLRKKRFLLQSPWEYRKNETYPLVISLHGWTQSNNDFFTPIIVNRQDQQENFPCFFLAPNNTTEGWNKKAAWSRKLVNELIETFPIDINRIYIIGFSMGGSGSFLFAEALYKDYGLWTAAIIRCAGKSQIALDKPLSEKTAVWYHVGSADSDEIIKVANDYIKGAKEQYFESSESLLIDSIGGYTRLTHTLKKNSELQNEFIKYSLYKGMGHDPSPVFLDEKVIEWLFRQTMETN